MEESDKSEKTKEEKNKNKKDESLEEEEEEPSTLKKAFDCLCGLNELKKQSNAQGEDASCHINTCIDEDPFWSRVCDVNAVIAIALCSFCYAFFNIFE